jgi:hypothetical protein
MDKNMWEDNQASYEASDGDKSRDGEEEEEDEYKGGRPPLFSDAAWRHTLDEHKRAGREAQAQELTRTTHISKAIQRFETKPMHSHCIPAKGIIIDMDKARHLYHTMYDDY